eukprot:451951_1
MSKMLTKLQHLSKRTMSVSSKMLQNEHIVVSGGIGSIGIPTIKAFVDHGAKVSIADVHSYEEASDRLLKQATLNLSENSSNVFYQQASITNSDKINEFIDAAYNKFGPINTACAHAGVVSVTPLLDENEQELRRILENNVVGTFLFAQSAARSMVQNTKSGNKHVLFTSSTCGEDNQPGLTSYCTSKAAVNGMMRSFALELAQFGIRCNVIAPGIVNCGMAKLYYDSNKPYHDCVEQTILFKGMQSVESVADLFVFLCSSSTDHMTGTVVTSDGGAHLSCKNTVDIYYEGIKKDDFDT